MNDMVRIFLVLVLSVFCLTGVSSGEPFAEKAEKPSNAGNDPGLALSITYLDAAQVPDRAAVGVPAYPGARIIQTGEKAQSGILANVHMLSVDEVTKVAEFYEKALSGWERKALGGTHSFWQGDRMEAMMGKAPTVQVTPADRRNELMPSAKTYIGIWYEPKE